MGVTAGAEADGTASIAVLDVGQGDAIYLRTSRGDDILIDGGPDAMVVERLGEVMPFWDRTIELMILSHPDADHIIGLLAVFDYYTVKQVAYEPLPLRQPLQRVWQEKIQQYQVDQIHPAAGDSITLSDNETITIIYPTPESSLDQLPSNDTSIVLLYEYVGANATTNFLTTGDISSQIEEQLVAADVLPVSDILKLPHHGSRYSSSAEFLAAVNPAAVVISAGRDNTYGHPHPDVLSRLADLPAPPQIFRTDQDGTIRFLLNDDGYTIITND